MRAPVELRAEVEPSEDGAAYFARPSAGPMVCLDPLRTHFLDHARGVEASVLARALVDGRTLAERRGYAERDLWAVAEIGYRYLINGGARFARLLFEGLTAVAPDEPYFTLALGLCADHAGDRAAARRHYTRASELDPGDGRPEVNLAELAIEAGDEERARRHLRTALHRLSFRPDEPLFNKARALLQRFERQGALR